MNTGISKTATQKAKRHTKRISAWFRSKLSSVSVDNKKTIWALTIVCMLLLGGLSIAGDRAEEGSVLLPPLPPPGAVLCVRRVWGARESALCTPSATVSLE